MRAILAVGCLALTVGLAGCGKGAKDAKSLSGKVTLNRKPLAGARVIFQPAGVTEGFGGVGTTDSAGEYQLKAMRGDVVATGEYKVVISRMVLPDGTMPPPEAKLSETNARESLPPYYTNPAITNLKATITEKGGKFDFDLQSR